MLLIQNGRLSYGGISFRLADGFYLDSEATVSYENGVVLQSIDGNFSMELQVEGSTDGTKKDLEDIVHGVMGSCVIMEDIAAFELNGLMGFACQYSSGRHQYYEARFDLGKHDGEMLVLTLCVTALKDVGIKTVLELPEVQAFISNIQKEAAQK